MNYLKYLTQKPDADCWKFVQKIIKDEHGMDLPDHPIMTDNADIYSFLQANVDYEIVEKAQKGCIVYYHKGNIYHAGYALNDKKFIHQTIKSVEISPIPQNSIIYKVLND